MTQPLTTMLLVLALAGLSLPARAQQGGPTQQGGPSQKQKAMIEQVNGNTVIMLTGSGSTYVEMGADIVAIVDQGDELRILPMGGQGAFQNVRDVRFLRGVDLAFTQSNVLGHYRRNKLMDDFAEKISYLLKICNNEVHLLARSEFTSIGQLRGKKVNFNQVGSGAQLASQDLFKLLGIEVQEVNLRQADAFEKLRTGEIAASVALAGKPVLQMTKFSTEKDGFRLLPIPYRSELALDFVPTRFSAQDYPGLVPGDGIETVASAIILIAYNWPRNTERYRRVEKFVNAFFPKLDEFRKPPRHEKWKETVLTANLPGFKRFPAAEDWIAHNHNNVLPESERLSFERFLAETGLRIGDGDQGDALFRQFLEWRKGRR